MVVLICLNIVLLMVESIDQSLEWKEEILSWMHFIFMIIFLIEFIVKIVVFRQHYFKDMWNIIDLLVLLFLIIGKFWTYGWLDG